MTDIQSHIARLLYTHNYVVIPGFGSFIGSGVKAKVSTHQLIVSPPKKQIVFNPELVQDDGLLVKTLAQSWGVDLNNCRETLDLKVSNWKKNLSNGKELVFDEIGKIFLNQQGKAIFRQFYVSNFLIPSYGLEIARAQPLNYLGVGSGYGLTSNGPKTVVIQKLPVSYKRFKAVSIGLIVLLSVSAVYLSMLSFNPTLVDKAGFNFFDVPVDSFEQFDVNSANEQPLEEVYERLEELIALNEAQKELEASSNKEISTSEEPEPKDESDVDDANIETSTETASEPEVLTENVEETTTETSQKSQYHVIVSSLDKLIKVNDAIKKYKVKGYDPIIIPTPKGGYRVSLGGFGSRDSAETFQKNISNDNNIDGWILKR